MRLLCPPTPIRRLVLTIATLGVAAACIPLPVPAPREATQDQATLALLAPAPLLYGSDLATRGPTKLVLLSPDGGATSSISLDDGGVGADITVGGDVVRLAVVSGPGSYVERMDHITVLSASGATKLSFRVADHARTLFADRRRDAVWIIRASPELELVQYRLTDGAEVGSRIGISLGDARACGPTPALDVVADSLVVVAENCAQGGEPHLSVWAIDLLTRRVLQRQQLGFFRFDVPIAMDPQTRRVAVADPLYSTLYVLSAEQLSSTLTLTYGVSPPASAVAMKRPAGVAALRWSGSQILVATAPGPGPASAVIAIDPQEKTVVAISGPAAVTGLGSRDGVAVAFTETSGGSVWLIAADDTAREIRNDIGVGLVGGIWR